MQIKCIKCGSIKCIKNGVVFGSQRYKCKTCDYQFTKVAPAGKPLFLKLICHTLYVSGLSMRQIANLVGVTAQSVSRWIKKWHPAYMIEVGEKSNVYKTQKENLLNNLKIKENVNLMVTTTNLPSGTKIHIIVEMPENSIKPL